MGFIKSSFGCPTKILRVGKIRSPDTLHEMKSVNGILPLALFVPKSLDYAEYNDNEKRYGIKGDTVHLS